MSMLLKAWGISFSYQKALVLHDVQVELGPGEIVTLIGPNGSGKSTLIKLLLGYLRGEGTIEWLGKPLLQWAPRQLARNVAYLAQSPAAASEQRVGDVLRLGRAAYWSAFGIESDRDIEVVREVSALLGLDDLLDRPLDSLSGGQRQMVFMGRCLVQQPKAMLLDEPSTFLDLRHQVEMLQLLRKLAKERGIGVLMASHDLNLSIVLADRLVLLHEGKVAAAGNAADVLKEDLLSRVYGVAIEVRDGRALAKCKV